MHVLSTNEWYKTLNFVIDKNQNISGKRKKKVINQNFIIMIRNSSNRLKHKHSRLLVTQTQTPSLKKP